MFVREDWTLFRNLGTLPQKAGVPLSKLRRLCLKELVDNALDACFAVVEYKKLAPNVYVVSDDGPGIDGDGDEIAKIFSIARPLTSTKTLRLPQRGALGNGLRVVVGAVLATGGDLTVETRGTQYKLRPCDDGSTRILSAQDMPLRGGTKVTVRFGEGLPHDSQDLLWANLAKTFSFAKRYTGKTSAYWYDSDSFFELLLAAGSRPVGELIASFAGFGDGDVETHPSQLTEPSKSCNSYGRDDAESLLARLCEESQPIKPEHIGHVGKEAGDAYQKVLGVLTIHPGRGKIIAELPFAVECWAVAKKSDAEEDNIIGYVNGTPVAGELRIRRDKPTKVAVFGCGLSHLFEGVAKQKFTVLLNITTPYMPITTDGKEPDFSRYYTQIDKAMTKATKKLRSNIRKASRYRTQQNVVLRHLEDSARKAGGGRYRYSIRQLYYVVRPHVLASGLENTELDFDYFSRIVGQWENDNGPLDGLYRDPRGTLYHPHLGRSIPLGTLAVEDYKRPEWTFNKILYCEKEGFTNLLCEVGWPERNDCALLSSKGFASRAVRDLFDLLGDTDEDLQFFCIHDADASGGLIYQALQGGTPARVARRVKIVNLGLEPWEALDMNLQVEQFKVKGGRDLPVAGYVQDYDDDQPPADEADDWKTWLQGRRVELNAMTSPQFIAWLDDKMKDHGAGKVVPPPAVLKDRLRVQTEAALRRRLAGDILRDANIDGLVAAELEARAKRLDRLDPVGHITRSLARDASHLWTNPLDALAEEIAGNGVEAGE